MMMYNSMDSFLLLAVPFFALTGFLMDTGGIAKRIFDFANALVGSVKGGLGNVVILSAMIFGGISGVRGRRRCRDGPNLRQFARKGRISAGLCRRPDRRGGDA